MLSRRRFLSIAASAAGLSVLPAGVSGAGRPDPVIWRGVVMGGMASMTLAHPDRAEARRLVDRALAEISRLEAIFSLYRPDSALVRLNRDGVLDAPPLELVELIGLSLTLARESEGAFDPTVQPLFQLYKRHFAANPSSREGPSRPELKKARRLVDHRAVEVGSDRIRLARTGMALTLNGIAQGFVTDRVAALLQGAGMENILLDLGEVRASGRHPDGRPWRAGIADPFASGATIHDLELDERPRGLPALATSGGYGLLFDQAGAHHHLVDPRTGASAREHASVSVNAPNATLADGLSTALSVLPSRQGRELLARFLPAHAFLVGEDGTFLRI